MKNTLRLSRDQVRIRDRIANLWGSKIILAFLKETNFLIHLQHLIHIDNQTNHNRWQHHNHPIEVIISYRFK